MRKLTDCLEDNRGYTQSRLNPTFWGWSAIGTVISTIMDAVYNSAGLYMAELQLPMTGVVNFPVYSHFVYDPTLNNGTDVLSLLRSYAGNYASVITFAPGDFGDDTYGTLDCASPWGGSAHFGADYAFIAMMNGQPFGWPNNPCNSWGSLLCASGTADSICSPGSHNTLTGLPQLPHAWSLPGTLRVGMFAHNADLNFSWQTFDNLVTAFSNLGRTVSLSETFSNENVEGTTTTEAQNLINALYHYANVTQMERKMYAFAIWADAVNWPPAFATGYVFPTPVHPPYPRYKCDNMSCPSPLSF